MIPVSRKTLGPRLVQLSGAAILLLASAASAAERQHDAHEHGVARLNVAAEGSDVEMELMSPGADIVGFEHAASTAEDKAAVERAVRRLQDGGALFLFPSEADCQLEEAEVNSALIEDEHDDHDDHGDHDHGAEKDGAAQEAHAEFHAHYHFHCDHPDELTHVDVKLFEHFPTLRELDVQVISPNGQSAQELTAAAARLSF